MLLMNLIVERTFPVDTRRSWNTAPFFLPMTMPLSTKVGEEGILSTLTLKVQKGNLSRMFHSVRVESSEIVVRAKGGTSKSNAIRRYKRNNGSNDACI
jgi:hypothetical protein